jgi:hypothetical protein
MSPAIRLLVRGLYSPNHVFSARNLFDTAKMAFSQPIQTAIAPDLGVPKNPRSFAI